VAGTSFGFSGDGGPAVEAKLDYPYDVAVDSAGNIYIADTTNNRVRKVSADTGYISTIAGGGDQQNTDNIQATQAQLSNVKAVAVDAEGIVYVAEDTRVRKIAANGTITTVAGGSSGISLNATSGIAVDAAGTLYIADRVNNSIVMVRNGSGEVIASGLSYPRMIAVGPDGSLYVADWGNQVIRRY
jgi:sugar lactone lactonase YvrE